MRCNLGRINCPDSSSYPLLGFFNSYPMPTRLATSNKPTKTGITALHDDPIVASNVNVPFNDRDTVVFATILPPSTEGDESAAGHDVAVLRFYLLARRHDCKSLAREATCKFATSERKQTARKSRDGEVEKETS
uniref:Uncharacterized protein n=1 Tax=Steinernema glaseri TaxID=37863 RepID=A0A1I7ZGN9_9BILA